MQALILDKDGTLFPYSLLIHPIKRVLEENLPLGRFDEEKRKRIVNDFLSVLSIKDNKIESSSLLFDRKKRKKGILKLAHLTLKYRLSPLRTMKGFLKIRKRHEYGLGEELDSYDLSPVRESLGHLREREIKIALFTNDSPSAVKAMEEKLGFVFDYHVDSSSRIRKPNKLAVLVFSTLMNIEPEDIVLLSDTPEDLRMGRESGCGKVVAITGSLGREELLPYADVVISKFGEITDFFS